ncbi:yippee-like protein [Gossypium arboreum]|uniref:Protein yippee-like n=1 Tax=Gossypium arboreum TaxID=29729 RepID=A0A0B0PBG7_GOSAR|nr:yippee-like protein [Gossypium arboreum]
MCCSASQSHTNPILYLCFSLSTAGMERLISLIRWEKEERMMMTGLHTVVDIFCVGCGSIVGWKYEAAHEKAQKYKEGKFILERFKVLGPDGGNYLAIQESLVGGSSDADDA